MVSRSVYIKALRFPLNLFMKSFRAPLNIYIKSFSVPLNLYIIPAPTPNVVLSNPMTATGSQGRGNIVNSDTLGAKGAGTL